MKSRRRWHTHTGIRWIVAWSAVLSFGSAPVPCPDFHDVQHHHEPGQTCPLHHHLSVLHPQAYAGSPLASLHCHWVRLRPHAIPFHPASQNDESESLRVDNLPDNADGLVSQPLESVPSLSHCRLFRWIQKNDQELAGAWGLARLALASSRHVVRDGSGPNPRLIHGFFATYSPDIPRSSLLSRWVC